MVLGITADDLMDIMSIRKHVEGLASYYATKNQTPEGIAELERIIELHDFYAAKRDYENMRRLDDEFHDTLCIMSKRTVLRDTLAPLLRKTRRYRKISIQDDARLQKCVEEHKEILAQVKAGNAEEAYRKTFQHISNAQNNLIGRLHYNV